MWPIKIELKIDSKKFLTFSLYKIRNEETLGLVDVRRKMIKNLSEQQQ